MRLEFRNGVVIDDPLGDALLFLENDYSYQSYDVLPIAQDATLTLDDIKVANRIGGRMSAAESAALFERRELFEDALARIPPNVTLCDATHTIPWEALADLYGAADGVSGIGLAKLTKFLHKKRPALIPILDSTVEAYLRSADSTVPQRSLVIAARATALTKSYKVDLDTNIDVIREVQSRLDALGYELTECRILDLFTWAYAGNVKPPWARTSSSTASLSSSVADAAPSVVLGPRFEAALEYMLHVHGGQVRKGTTIPYVGHLLGVAALVLEDSGDEDEAIAALLHDAVEDGGGSERLSDIRHRYGPRVARIVSECSDTDLIPKPPWRERKEAYIAHLATASDSAIRVSLADKVHNARAIVRDHREIGDELWSRFHPDSDQGWYYGALLEAFEARAHSSLLRELRSLVSEMTTQVDTPA